MPASTNIEVLHAALKDAEDELCSLGHILVNQGWDTDSITMTIDVLRIALYGTDGRGNGPEHFDKARAQLVALRKEEAASAEYQPTAECPVCKSLQDQAFLDAGEQPSSVWFPRKPIDEILCDDCAAIPTNQQSR